MATGWRPRPGERPGLPDARRVRLRGGRPLPLRWSAAMTGAIIGCFASPTTATRIGSGWDRTTGQSARPRSPRQDFLGKALDSPHAIYRCLSCHTTSPRSVQRRAGPDHPTERSGASGVTVRAGNHLGGGRGAVPRPGDRRPARFAPRDVNHAVRRLPRSPPGRCRQPAHRSRLAALPGDDAPLEPLLHRERRRDELRDLPRPAPRRRDLGGVLRGEVPGVPRGSEGRALTGSRPRPARQEGRRPSGRRRIAPAR